LEDIDTVIEKGIAQNCHSVISVCKAGQHPFKMFCANEEGALETLVISNTSFPKSVEYLRRQDLPEAYQENGAIYLHRSADILACRGKDLPFRKFCKEGSCFSHVMSSDRSIDIDTYFDLQLAEMHMARINQQDGVMKEEDELRSRIAELERDLDKKTTIIKELEQQR